MHDGNESALIVQDEATPRKRRKGIYILPNLFTLAALFGGFYAVVMAMNNRFDLASVGVFCAMVLDSLDGRVARMTNTQSAFGEQMDSLSDMVSFGAAPALIAYEWTLREAGRWGWIAAFVYCACAALRLARFNVNTGVVDKRWFQGLPSPAAAALVTGFIWLMTELEVARADVTWFMFALALYAGLTMVTNVPFYSFKDVQMKKSVPFVVIVLIALGIAIVNIHPPIVMFGLFVVYGFSGYAVYAWRKAKGHQTSVISTSTDEPDERGLHK
ncbi:CDP-diacylglycerol--serine O-phosphatidyltransferase [Pseudorhodoferax sp. Leaf265]|uniref:CDP-diacylglycerol--serine O-phosphatidyltransferase n=1 Tax=Pseudorhodoferax sp. Leaf265 TaxID=1736315 RepID=UPI0006FEC585|nr:CDP-diacylglycerol--serine O-phosphatidyltransferase [Pseudorhodoferax sp. Leaf265]KQP19172.1 CDP-diacylglycerol--serine O-phosphatidyltransferase [Pseudorhodoferax sp. Leaf265]PZP98515.1 MAG: CDP-diacylglycerol--serine O-phosphatidyltransferase [Variovorax paradoxus]PZQ09917.1 MAG: CDP-diacylglycerol--serine O-phosphatidyltransferase [Variovorax paradoxus]